MNTSSTNSDTNSDYTTSDIIINYSNSNKNSYDSSVNVKVKDDSIKCGICNTTKNDTFVILSCNHLFHTNCFVEKQFTNIYNYNTIDSTYLNSRECLLCNKHITLEELMFAHSKYISRTKTILESHNYSISSLEDKLKKLNDELKVCYDYKYKLESDREKCKNIINSLMVML